MRVGSASFIATKVVLDEGVFGPIHVLGFFAYMTLAEGGSWQVRISLRHPTKVFSSPLCRHHTNRWQQQQYQMTACLGPCISGVPGHLTLAEGGSWQVRTINLCLASNWSSVRICVDDGGPG